MTLLMAMGAVSSVPEALEQAQRQLAQRDEAQALQTLEDAKVLAAGEPALLAQVYEWIGLVHAARADEKSAKAAFQTALALEPQLQLAPGQSPKVRAWWSEVGGLDAPTAVPAEPQKVRGSRWIWPTVGAVVALASGGLTTYQANRRYELIDRAAQLQTGDAQRIASEGRQWQAGAIASYVIAGALVATAVVLWLMGV